MVSVSCVQSISICLQTDAVLAIQKHFVYSLPFKKKKKKELFMQPVLSDVILFIYTYYNDSYMFINLNQAMRHRLHLFQMVS